MIKLELYHPIIFDHISLLPEFLEIIRTNSHRTEGILDIYLNKADIKIHTYALLLKKPALPVEPAVEGFNVAYILPLMGATVPNPAYKGMGRKVNEAVSMTASLFGVKIFHLETSVGLPKTAKCTDDYLWWWRSVVKDVQPKLTGINKTAFLALPVD